MPPRLGNKARSTLQAGDSLHWLGLREIPGAVQDFLPRPVHSDDVVPARHDGNAVRRTLVAAELNRHRTVRIRLGGDVIHGVGVPRVLLEVAVVVVLLGELENRYKFFAISS